MMKLLKAEWGPDHQMLFILCPCGHGFPVFNPGKKITCFKCHRAMLLDLLLYG